MAWIKAHRRTLIVLALLPAVAYFYSLVLAARPSTEFPMNVVPGQFDLTAAILFGVWGFVLGRVWGK
jgi:hypothetical protein